MPLNTLNVNALENLHLKMCMLQALYFDCFKKKKKAVLYQSILLCKRNNVLTMQNNKK